MIPKLVNSLKIRPITLPNIQRTKLPPMCMYTTKDVIANGFHFVYYGTRAIEKVGLIVMKAIGVVFNGRITPYCLEL